MDRNVHRVETTPSGSPQREPHPLSYYDETSNLILLGDPGAGKTHAFRECAARTSGQFITARAFLVKVVLELLRSGKEWRIADVEWDSGTLRDLYRRKATYDGEAVR
jgi:hypothetical protein